MEKWSSVQQPPLSMLETFAPKKGWSLSYILYWLKTIKTTLKVKDRSGFETLEEDISITDWHRICLKGSNYQHRLRLIQFIWIKRTYISPVQLNKFDPRIPDLCHKCNIHQGALYHCLWKCEEIPLCPKICILGIYPDNCPLSSRERKMIDFCLLCLHTFHCSVLEKMLAVPLLVTG